MCILYLIWLHTDREVALQGLSYGEKISRQQLSVNHEMDYLLCDSIKSELTQLKVILCSKSLDFKLIRVLWLQAVGLKLRFLEKMI